MMSYENNDNIDNRIDMEINSTVWLRSKTP